MPTEEPKIGDQEMDASQVPSLDRLSPNDNASLPKRFAALVALLKSDLGKRERERAQKEQSLRQVRAALAEARQGNLEKVGLLYEAMRDNKSPHYIRPGVDLDAENPLTPAELYSYLMDFEGKAAASPTSETPNEEGLTSPKESAIQEFLRACAKEFQEGNFENLVHFRIGQNGALEFRDEQGRLRSQAQEMMDQCGISLENLNKWLPSETQIQIKKTHLMATLPERVDSPWVVNRILTPYGLSALTAIIEEVQRGELRELVFGSFNWGDASLYTLHRIGRDPLKDALRETLKEAMIMEGKLLLYACRNGDLRNLMKLWSIIGRPFSYNSEAHIDLGVCNISFSITPEQVGTTMEEYKKFRDEKERREQAERDERERERLTASRIFQGSLDDHFGD